MVLATGLTLLAQNPQEAALTALKRGDFPALAVELRKQVEAHDPEAASGLGLLYYFGRGVPRDLKEARVLFRLGATGGEPEAAYRLGFMCRKGEGGERNLPEALQWLQKGADKGNLDAAYELGMMHALGEGVPQDNSKALPWMRKAADKGHVQAALYLADGYFHGRAGLEQSYHYARDYYKIAADRGDVQAQNDLALIYEKAEKLLGGFNIDWDGLALKYYEMAANQGHVPAMIGMGRLLIYSRNGVGNWKRAEEVLRPLADAHHPEAAYMLGYIYLQANPWQSLKKPDLAAALRFYTLAAENGKLEAYADVGLCFEKGNGVPQNFTEAMKWYAKGAEKGEKWCAHNVGVLIENGKGVPADANAAMGWFQKAAALGNEVSAARLGEMLEARKQWPEALVWFSKAVDLGNGITARYVGDKYNPNDREHQWVDPETAIQWYEKGADIGDGDCMRRAGMLHFQAQRYAKAAHYLDLARRKAFLTDYQKGMLASCERYLGNDAAAAKLYKELSQSGGKWGDAYAKRQLAELYAKGKGVPKDAAEARRLLESAQLTDTLVAADKAAAEADRARRDQKAFHPENVWPTHGPIALCPICKGTGMHDGVGCRTCAGHGKVEVKD